MIIMTQKQFEEILVHSLSLAPVEACGLLGGVIQDGAKVIKKVYLLKNIDNSPVHFTMDAKEQFESVKDMRKNGYELLGNFHSHPGSPSRPSEEDENLAFDPETSYLILSLLNREKPVLKSFNIKDRIVGEEEIILIDGGIDNDKNRL